MRRMIVLAVAGTFFATAGTAVAQPETLVQKMVTVTGEKEFPDRGDLDGRGHFSWVLAGDELCYLLTLNAIALPATAAHIHRGTKYAAGPVVVEFEPPTSGASAECITIASDLADEIRANPRGFYFNVHNADFPAGAARGQLR